ncbi:phosphate ABC transporter permease subunit PstC [Helicovermis profundi]|uniref:Phosphate ABC transporter permease subunit PstC n=1 Tax=Helicovermis profundi TaxID=3065157 RepID=A0AAU9E359_9FIRM|nr:phosphate ABC transporter permease subunit PstC [Clostridia bacterium S502]
MITIDRKKYRKKKKIENIIEKTFLVSALVSILSLLLIMIFIFGKGAPAINKIGLSNFIFGLNWEPSADIYGIFPMILASLYVTFGAIVIGVPIGVFTAIFLSEIAPKWLGKIVESAVQLLAGIPSVIYGFFGLLVIVPLIDKYYGGGGNSILAAIIILSAMILPTIITISENAIKAVPKEYKEGSLALGSSEIQTIFKVILPAAKSGILTSVVLGIGRAIGETMAVILVIGNTVQLPSSILDRARTLTANIAIEMGYAYGLHQEALFATGVILFIFIMIINFILNFLIIDRNSN